jgi:hypothetical protein
LINARKILKDIVENLDTTLYIDSVEVVAGGYKLFTCDTIHLAVGKVINYNGNDYTLTQVEQNEYVVFETVDVISAPYTKTAITFPLYFYSAKLRDASAERDNKVRVNLVEYPFIWIREPYQNTIQDEFQSYRDFDIDMYLLDDCLMVGEGVGVGDAWETETHHNQVINPLSNLWNNRLKKAIVNNYKYVSDWQGETVRGLAFVEEDVNKSLFEEKLSGVNVRINLHFNIQGCKCK